jgi:hypothetical protein
MNKQRWIATSVALAVVAAAWLAVAHAALAQSRDALVEKYTPLAGSKDNAAKLIDGLRKDNKLGYGEVNIALSLTSARLHDKGIDNPTPQQLQTSLNEVLSQRTAGKGWGEIAHSMGFKLGEVMRNPKADRAERVTRQAKVERPERPARPEKPERPERPERPGR